MSMWDNLPIEALIEQETARFSAGLARQTWTKQLEQIRALPEAPDANDEQQPTEENDG